MAQLSIFELRDSFSALSELLVHLGRYRLLLVLSSGNYQDKCHHASDAYHCIELAQAVEEHLFRYIQQRPHPVRWLPALHPERNGVLLDGTLHRERLDQLIETIVSGLSASIQSILHNLKEEIAFGPWIHILKRVSLLVDSEDKHGKVLNRYERSHTLTVTRSAIGPKVAPLDISFQRTYSLTQYRSPEFSNNLGELTAYFWTLSIREAMACDSCALSAAEYDGLPIQFYRDLMKQTWDEARHAVMVFDLSKTLMIELMRLPEFENTRIREIIAGHMNGRNPLPVPLEGNLYETMWNASLEERLVLMQIQTEGRAVGSLRRKIRSEISKKMPTVRHALEIDQRDEISHTMIGRKWLAHLLPSALDREELVERTNLLRAIMISAAISHYSNCTLSTVLNSAISPATQSHFLPNYL